MTPLPFYLNATLWVLLLTLESYWLAGFLSASLNHTATERQMRVHWKRAPQMSFVEHYGFWSVLLFVHPALAVATAKLWPQWHAEGGLIAGCFVGGGWIGYGLQRYWSLGSGRIDTWSKDGLPNRAGIIHIIHMALEVGILLMLLYTAMMWLSKWWPMTNWSLFFGVSAVVANHALIGTTHWPTKLFCSPERLSELGMERMSDKLDGVFLLVGIPLLGGGFYLIFIS